MTKVHPNAAVSAAISRSDCLPKAADNAAATVLTVWKKSLLMSCDGFTVFDARGDLVFRVDNYVAGKRGEVVLMDASGNSLLTIRRKKLSLAGSWLVYDGEASASPQYSVRKHVNFLNTKIIAHVSLYRDGSWRGSSSSPFSPSSKNIVYEIEGSYANRCYAVYDARRRLVAEIKRKEAVGGVALGTDVFRLVVQPEINSAVAMAVVIVLDQMFGSSKRFLA